MSRTEIRVEGVDAFFERGRKLAESADRGESIAPARVVAFEDVEALLRVLSEKRVLLLREVRSTPASISDLARRLKRDRSAVTRDVQLLQRFGVVHVTDKLLPGHGRMRWVSPVARDIRLTARI